MVPQVEVILKSQIADINILTRVVGGRALIRSEPYGKDDAYEYIRRIYCNLNHSVIDCSDSGYEK